MTVFFKHNDICYCNINKIIHSISVSKIKRHASVSNSKRIKFSIMSYSTVKNMSEYYKSK